MAIRLVLGVLAILPITGFTQISGKNLPVYTVNLSLFSSGFDAEEGKLQSEHNHETHEKHQGREHSSSEQVKPVTTWADSKAIEVNKEHHDENERFSSKTLALADINVETIEPKKHAFFIYAPGEIKANGYKSYLVAPRTDSVIIRRHATLGEHVKEGQALVTLFSETMAQAQADYLVASTEWQRVKKLGKTTVSESQLLQAETAFNASFGKLYALGMTEQAIGNISIKNSKTLGQYSLIAQRAGVVLQDDFTQGQRVAAGDSVMLLADEQDLWVEAKVAPNKELNISLNASATVEFSKQKFAAKVIQEAHTIDPQTRTRIIRLSVANDSDRLHSGMFVKIYFHFMTDSSVMAVPEEALVRSADGDWIVFVEQHPGEFTEVAVTLGRSLGKNREIFGLASGSKVVTQGAFFIASEFAKSGFDPHNH